MNKLVIFLLAAGILALAVREVSSAEEDTYLSEDIQRYCIEIGEQYGICPELLMAVIERESGGQPDAVNGGCRGLMQISERWHRARMERLGVTDIFGEYSNILLGADYLAELFKMYGDPGLVLMAYHGEKNVLEKAESGKISKYAQWILERSTELEYIHGK